MIMYTIIYSEFSELGKPFLFVLNHLYTATENLFILSKMITKQTTHLINKQGENKKQTGFLLVK